MVCQAKPKVQRLPFPLLDNCQRCHKRKGKIACERCDEWLCSACYKSDFTICAKCVDEWVADNDYFLLG